ncbi:MAG: secretion system protein [Gammaproteobacteria bacterium RIFCSPLOWO2_02_FULL_56_15]|nr:MAG: secretion system protein [Gammaproteobacteria bacterium RIFCSPLOWO2_02_FULL_56_15]
MEYYQYKAIDPEGRIHNGQGEAINIADLEMRLRKLRLDLINYKEIRSPRQRASGRGIPRRDLIMFCFHLEQTTRAGVPILESLSDLRDSTDNPRMREIVSGVGEAIEGGKTLSEAMKEYPGVFSNVFCNLIRAGEQTGEINVVFAKLIESLKWQDEQASQTKKLIMYPAFVGTVVIGVIIFLMTYLVPELLKFVTTMGKELPMHTRVLLMTSDAFVNYWYIIISVPILLVVLAVVMTRVSPGFRTELDRIKLRLPIIGPILKKIILSRIAGYFAMMYASGITIIDCIRTSEEIAENRVVSAAMREVGQRIMDGGSLSKSFAATGLFPPLVLRMIVVGETTGGLEESLENISYFYTRDVRESLERLQTMIGPAMTVGLGGIIGWVMFSVLGPIYDLISNIDF